MELFYFTQDNSHIHGIAIAMSREKDKTIKVEVTAIAGPCVSNGSRPHPRGWEEISKTKSKHRERWRELIVTLCPIGHEGE